MQCSMMEILLIIGMGGALMGNRRNCVPPRETNRRFKTGIVSNVWILEYPVILSLDKLSNEGALPGFIFKNIAIK